MNRLRKFFGRSAPDQLLLIEAAALLLLAKILIHGIPFRWLAPRLGEKMTESPREVDTRAERTARRVGWAVEAVARHSPVKFVCFPQAVAAKWMMRRRGFPSTLYLGLKMKAEDSLMAHAWARVGNRIITGFDQSRTHKTIAYFAEKG